MPGSYTRPPPASAEWRATEWHAYRADLLAYLARTGDAAWWANVGAASVRMAEVNIARLGASEVETSALE